MRTVLSQLFRSIESELGTHAFCILVLDALKKSLQQYKISSKEEFDQQLLNIFKLIHNTKPRYAILLDSFYKILEIEDTCNTFSRAKIIKEINKIGKFYDSEKKQMIKIAENIDVNDKNILIHDHSHSVHEVLLALKNKHKKFSVIVAEQDLEKTADNISFLHKNQIPFKVVPAHMLSHIDKTIDLVFCGTVTFQENLQFVMDPGSKAMISHFHLEKKPIYVFITSSKLTLWPLIEQCHEVYAKPQKRIHHSLKEVEFERLKFSHDRVFVNLFDHIVTENKIYRPLEFVELFKRLFKERSTKRKRFFEK